MFALSGAAAGAGDELEALLKQKFIEMVQRKQLAQGDRRLGQEDRSLDMQGSRDAVSAELGRRRATVDEGGLKLGQDRHGEDVRQFDALAPTREAGVARTQALTGELKRKPEAEQQERAFTTSRDRTLHGYRVGEIGAQGDQQVRVANVRHPDAAGTAAAEKQANEVQQLLDTITEIENDKALPLILGSVDGRLPTGMMRDAAGYERVKAKHDNLVGRLELAQAGKLKGQGQISNFEREMLARAATALRRTMSDQDYKAELGKIRAVMSGQARPMTSRDGGPVTVNVNGQTFTFPDQRSADAFKAKAGIR